MTGFPSESPKVQNGSDDGHIASDEQGAFFLIHAETRAPFLKDTFPQTGVLGVPLQSLSCSQVAVQMPSPAPMAEGKHNPVEHSPASRFLGSHASPTCFGWAARSRKQVTTALPPSTGVAEHVVPAAQSAGFLQDVGLG
jgi:hypothetical protein